MTLEEAKKNLLLWSTSYTWANVAIEVEASGLIFVGPDGKQAQHDWQARGLPPTTFRFSHNNGYLYKRPDGCALARSCKPTYGDIVSGGLVTVAGTHALGDEIYTTDDEPTEAPDWVVELLASSEAKPVERPVTEGTGAEPPVRLYGAEAKGLWYGSLVVNKAGNVVAAEKVDIDRSNTLFRIGTALADARATRSTIADALAERDKTLGYNKYSERKDGGENEYYRIAGKAVESRENVFSGSARSAKSEPTTSEEDTEAAADASSDVAPWPDPLDPAALYGLVGEFIDLVEPHSEADPVAIHAQFMVLYGNVVGHEPYFPVEASKHYVNEDALIVGPTAKARKGTGGDIARRCFETVDSQWANSRIIGGMSSGEGLIWNVRDPIITREPIKEKGRVVGYQDVETDAGVIDKRLMIIESEFAAPLAVLNRDANTLSPVLRQCWDNGNLRITTKNSPAVATGAHVSIIGHITRDELIKKMADNEIGNGFANRFLPVASKRSKCLPEGGELHKVDFGPFERRLIRAVAAASKIKEMRRDDLARELWAHVYPTLSEGTSGLLGSVTARAEAHVLRLSMLYALMDGSDVITADHLLAALAMWDYCFASARWLFGSRIGDKIADTIMDALRQAPDGLTREAFTNLFDRNKTAKEIGRALSTLASAGAVTMTKVQGERGRPTEVWRISSFSSFTSYHISFCNMAKEFLSTKDYFFLSGLRKLSKRERESYNDEKDKSRVGYEVNEVNELIPEDDSSGAFEVF